jgi:hypothetical protein
LEDENHNQAPTTITIVGKTRYDPSLLPSMPASALLAVNAVTAIKQPRATTIMPKVCLVTEVSL